MISIMSADQGRRRPSVWFERFGVAFFYLMLWAAAARAVGQPLLLPSPAQVLSRLLTLLPEAGFWLTLLGTLGRTGAAYLLGILSAGVLGALCCRFRAVDLLLSPLLSAVRATPVTSFIVLALVWLSSHAVPVLTGFLMTLPIVFSSLTQAVREIDPRLMEVARIFHYGRKNTLLYVILPAILPSVTQSCLAAIGLCWKAVVAAEVIGVPKFAVGSRLYEAKIYLETDSLLAWTLTIVLLSVVLEKLFRRATARLMEVRHD